MNFFYDMTGVDVLFDVLTEHFKEKNVTIRTSQDFFNTPQNELKLNRHFLLLSDNEFPLDMPDQEILDKISELLKIEGYKIIYLGNPREDDGYFESCLSQFGTIYLLKELETEDVIDLLETVLSENQDSLVSEADEQKVESDKEIPDETSGELNITEPEQKLKSSIVISGPPGIGSTFIALQTAALRAEKENISLVETGIRPVLATWFMKEEEASLLQLAVGNDVSGFQIENLEIVTVDGLTQDASDISVDTLFRNIRGLERELCVIDLPLSDYANTLEQPFSDTEVRVLVTNSDLHRCKWLEGLFADIVVVNQTPKRLPFDKEEFQKIFPDATLVFVPFAEDQYSSIAGCQICINRNSEIQQAIEELNEKIDENLKG